MSSNGAEKSNKDQLEPEKSEEMWNRAATITKIVASSVKISETAGGVIKVGIFLEKIYIFFVKLF